MNRPAAVNFVFWFILVCLVKASSANWWLLGMPSTYQSTLELKATNYKQHCSKLHYLVKRQRELCDLSENVLKSVGNGAKMGIDECQYQFRMSRWNCSTFSDSPSVFGGMLKIRSREKAYVYAVSAAGVAYSITRSCSKGEIAECGCDDKVRTKSTKGKWEWGGCSEDVRFGESFSKDFVDSRENENEAEGLMNLHNNEAGRRSIRSKMELVCKCHGVSGSCSVRVCWRRMATFRLVGDELTARLDGASFVKMVKRKKKRLRPMTKNRKKTHEKRSRLPRGITRLLRKKCVGVLGTQERTCNRSSYGMDGCRLLCCGRGYHTLIHEVTDKCNCRFVWCCRVMCEQCTSMVDETRCN
uniref:Protein Wnt n=1 Tax=Strigamia maritima TaxID=126957 RepID=T1JPJ6_STRMM